MTYYSFIVPREVFYGPSALEALATVPGKRVFIVTDQTIRNLGLVDRIELRSRTLRNKARYVAISTTSGTGSEVTPVAVISDHATDPLSKPPLMSPQLMPDVAITDPELPASMPPAVTANTGFDALAHAIECYVCTSRPRDDLIGSLALGAAKHDALMSEKVVLNDRKVVGGVDALKVSDYGEEARTTEPESNSTS